MLSVRKAMEIQDAYREVGTYRGAAEMCGTTHKTVKRLSSSARKRKPSR